MKTEFKSFIIIAIIYLLLVFIVPPDGEFPINDDWAYASNVKYLFCIISSILSLGFLGFLIKQGNQSHFFGGIINQYGFGPISIVDNTPYNSVYILSLTVLVIISTAITLLLIYNEIQIRKKESSSIALVYFIGLSYFTSLAILPGLFDRYILPLIPIILVLLLSSIERVRELPFFSAILGIILVIFAIFSVVGTYDFLNYNRTLWTALNKLMESGISPEDIDGGFEFNCWFLYDYCLKKFGNIDPIYPGNKNITQRICVVNNDYVISLSELPGYFILDKLKYFSHMGNTYIDIYVLKKVN
ncbi:MAG: hypothetical protein QW802_00155 [Candidatus Altiarchaeota archaeon]